jgi:hypothetical protein
MLQKGKKVFGNGLVASSSDGKYYYNWIKDREHLELVNV